jgi:haloalkane dehalogenase
VGSTPVGRTVRLLRTPDHHFTGLPDFPYAPHYVSIPAGDGSSLRVHYIDEGPRRAPIVLLFHGEPSWCFSFRKVIRILLAAGLRVVAPDLVGCGRSDKPAAPEDYTYQRLVDWMQSVLHALSLPPVTLLCHDWGGLIGLRLVAADPERFLRVLAVNTSLPTGDGKAPDAFLAWQSSVRSASSFSAASVVAGACEQPLPAEVLAAYDAPFPDPSHQAAIRRLPLLVPTSPEDPASAPNRRAWQALARFTRPFLTIFGDRDPFTRGSERAFQRRIPGAAGLSHKLLAGAGHFIQEDAGDELGRLAVEFVAG